MKIGIVVNPVAGGGRNRGRIAALLSSLRNRFPCVAVEETARPGDAVHLAHAFAVSGVDAVLAAGGDGTIGDVADGILKSKQPHPSFGFLPMGTGCDYARNFPGHALSRLGDAETFAKTFAALPARKVDAGKLTCAADNGSTVTRHFVNIASAGVSGPIVQAVNRAGRGGRLPGSLRFLACSLREIFRYRPHHVRVVLDGVAVHEGPVTVVAVANGRWFGGGMMVAPDAKIDDGLFDVVIVRGASRLKLLLLMALIYGGWHVRHPLVSCHTAKTVEMKPLAGTLPALLDCDGEAPGCLPARFELLPGALTLKA